MKLISTILFFTSLFPWSSFSIAQVQGEAWKMHIIDNEGFGADGARFYQHKKANLFTVYWEQSGYSRIYFYNQKFKKKHTLQVPSEGVEDALTADLNNDGELEVLTFQEKPANQIQLHQIKGKGKNAIIHSQVISGDLNQQWMYGEVHDFNGDGLQDFVAGSKNENGSVTLFLHPKHEDENWEAIRLYDAGWIMSIKLLDMDADGDMDVLISDRRGEQSGIKWLENAGASQLSTTWKVHEIGLKNTHPFFLNAYKREGRWVILASEKHSGFYRFESEDGFSWKEEKLFAIPENCGGEVKDIALADLDKDGIEELITVYNRAYNTHGIIYSKQEAGVWKHHAISGLKGPKFDLVVFADMDNDGDLDVLNTEENDNSNTEAGLGFVWYENPLK